MECRMNLLLRLVGNNGIDRYRIIADKSVAHRKHKELFYLACRFADTPAKQHIEFQTASFTDFSQFADIYGTNNVTIGIGAFIHISNAYARVVSAGLTSCIIFLMQSYADIFAWDRRKETFTQDG